MRVLGRASGAHLPQTGNGSLCPVCLGGDDPGHVDHDPSSFRSRYPGVDHCLPVSRRTSNVAYRDFQASPSAACILPSGQTDCKLWQCCQIENHLGLYQGALLATCRGQSLSHLLSAAQCVSMGCPFCRTGLGEGGSVSQTPSGIKSIDTD